MLRLPADGQATLLAPYPLVGPLESPSRLWMAALVVPAILPDAVIDLRGVTLDTSATAAGPSPLAMAARADNDDEDAS